MVKIKISDKYNTDSATLSHYIGNIVHSKYRSSSELDLLSKLEAIAAASSTE